MGLTPSPATAALAGVFSGLTWPLIWPYFGGAAASGTVWLVLATVGLVALPAHAFVLGFERRRVGGAGAVDSALLIRIATWLACAAGAAVVGGMLRGPG